MSESVSHSHASITMATVWSAEETKALLGAVEVQIQLARNRTHTSHRLLELNINNNY